jgi:hypothetical protein
MCDDTFLDDFDHRPVWIDINIPEGIHNAGRGQKYSRPPLPIIKLKDNEKQLEAFNLLLKEFREKNPIPVDSIEEIPGLLTAAHLETIKAVTEVSGNFKSRIHEKCKPLRSRCSQGRLLAVRQDNTGRFAVHD